MTNPPIDEPGEDVWGGFSPEKLHLLAAHSGNFAVARRLISTIATAAEDDDGGDSLGRLLLEVATSDPVSIALACATEAVLHAREAFGSHAGAVLALRAQRQIDLAERNAREFPQPE
jgi:hypothetical protein